MGIATAHAPQQPEPTLPFAPAIGFARNRETAPAYWMLDLLWLVLVDGHETGGAFSVMEQWMRQGSGPPIPHIHPIDEWFYVMEGEMTVELGDQTIIGRAGDSLWIPRGTVHRFKVTSPLCRALNGYTPAGFEQAIIVRPNCCFREPPARRRFATERKSTSNFCA